MEPITYQNNARSSGISYASIGRFTFRTIETIAIPIILALSISATVYFAFNPIQIVQLHPSFSISLPLLICSSTGLALCIYLVIQVAVLRKHLFQCIAREQIHRGSKLHQKAGLPLGFDKIDILTRDNVRLNGVWHFKNHAAPTVIVFGGRGMSAASAARHFGKFYKNQCNCNVLFIDYRGYGESKGKKAKAHQEIEAYYDAEAAFKFVHVDQKIPLNQIVAHGYSLGGAYAAALGYFFDVPKIILNHTFTSTSDVAKNVAPRLFKNITGFVVRHSYKRLTKKRLPFGARPLKTDNFNTLKKVKQIASRVLVIHGDKDEVMPQSFGQRLSEKRFQALYTINGSHKDGFRFFNNPSGYEGGQEALKVISEYIHD